jgi:hypothetical protein
MKSSSVYSPFTALALKIVGLIMILSSLLDYIILAIPSPGVSPLKSEWQLALTSQLVDRGIIPMVGIALLVTGYWIANSVGASEAKSSVQDLRFWAFILSSLLGLIFLLLVPLHFNNIRLQSDAALKQINQRATQAETQLDNQTKQVDALVKDPQKLSELDKAIQSGQVKGPQLAQLQALREQLNTFKQDPKALNQQVEAAQTQIRSGRLEAEKRARSEALKLGLRTGLSSLLLAIGYIAIGWTGLRNLGGAGGR